MPKRISAEMYPRGSGAGARSQDNASQSIAIGLMGKDEPKKIVSMSIDTDLLNAITAEIEAVKKSGEEMDFSKWMRDAVRRKLRRFKTRKKR